MWRSLHVVVQVSSSVSVKIISLRGVAMNLLGQLLQKMGEGLLWCSGCQGHYQDHWTIAKLAS